MKQTASSGENTRCREGEGCAGPQRQDGGEFHGAAGACGASRSGGADGIYYLVVGFLVWVIYGIARPTCTIYC